MYLRLTSLVRRFEEQVKQWKRYRFQQRREISENAGKNSSWKVYQVLKSFENLETLSGYVYNNNPFYIYTYTVYLVVLNPYLDRFNVFLTFVIWLTRSPVNFF